MPHLSQLQRDYKSKNVTIIGMTSGDKSNTLEAVKKMVEAKGDGMDYAVAFDDGRKTNEAWMKAAGQRGIPASFLVDQSGKIAWIGHPGGLDYPLAAVVAGTWDYVEGPKKIKAASTAKRAIYMAASSEPKKALDLLTKYEKDYPLQSAGLDDLRFSILTQIPEQKAAAATLGTKLVDKAIASKSHSALNEIAWNLVDPAVDRKDRFLDLALRAADGANELTEDKDPAILDTVARVHFWRGDLTQALEIQRRAIENAKGGMKDDLKKTLLEYEEQLAGE